MVFSNDFLFIVFSCKISNSSFFFVFSSIFTVIWRHEGIPWCWWTYSHIPTKYEHESHEFIGKTFWPPHIWWRRFYQMHFTTCVHRPGMGTAHRTGQLIHSPNTYWHRRKYFWWVYIESLLFRIPFCLIVHIFAFNAFSRRLVWPRPIRHYCTPFWVQSVVISINPPNRRVFRWWPIHSTHEHGPVVLAIVKWAQIMGQPFMYKKKRTTKVCSKFSGCTATIINWLKSAQWTFSVCL